MKPLDRDISILRHIVTYCEQIEQKELKAARRNMANSHTPPGQIFLSVVKHVVTADMPKIKQTKKLYKQIKSG